MKVEEYCRYDAMGLVNLIQRREVSPKEVALSAYLAIKMLNEKLNAVIDLYPDRIDSLDDRLLTRGPFHGVPFLVKAAGGGEAGRPMDNYGSLLMSNAPLAQYDLEIISRFKEAGLNLIGRTIVPEMGATITIESPHQGITHNPWSLERVAGGSSTGAAVAVAAGMVPIAHANDSGGSIRLPASCNGLIGLKCSRGRVSLGPDGSDVAYPTSSQFAITRTVRDCAALLDAVEGVGASDGYIKLATHPKYLEEICIPIDKLRIAVSLCGWGASAHPDVTNSIELLAKKLEGMGHTLEVVVPKIDFSDYRSHFMTLYFVGINSGLSALSEVMQRAIDERTVQPMILKLYRESKKIGLEKYVNALQFMNQATRSLAEFFKSYDLILTPTLGMAVPELGYLSIEKAEISVEDFCSRLYQCSQYLQLANFAGVPAISIPVCHTPDGMPLGAQFVAPMGREDILLRLAATLEELIPWRNHLPGIHISKG